MRAALTVHPGMPKTGTTGLQSLFIHDDYALSRQMGRVWLGKRFKPFNRRPPVEEFRDHRERTLRDLAACHPDPAEKYFLSSESLVNRHDFLGLIAEKFEIDGATMTVRLPFTMRLSLYCFVGWTRRSIAEFFPEKSYRVSQLRHAISGVEKVTSVRPRLCPIEAGNLASTFCTITFGTAPRGIDDVAKEVGTRNQSISPLLAQALSGRLMEERNDERSADEIKELRRRTAETKAPKEFNAVLPGELAAIVATPGLLKKQVADYRQLLRAYRVPRDVADRAVESASSQLRSLISKKAASPALVEEADRFAAWLMSADFDPEAGRP